MFALIALNLVFFLIAFFAVYRSGRPWALSCLYALLTVAASTGVFFLSTSHPDLGGNFVYGIASAWIPPQQGDPVGASQLVSYLIATISLGNLISLVIVSGLGVWMAARRQAG